MKLKSILFFCHGRYRHLPCLEIIHSKTQTKFVYHSAPSGRLFFFEVLFAFHVGLEAVLIRGWHIAEAAEELRGPTCQCSPGHVANSVLFCWLFTIKDRCKKVRFQQTHNQGLHRLSLMLPDTVNNNWRKPWLCVCWKRTFLHRSLIVKSQQKRIELLARPGFDPAMLIKMIPIILHNLHE